MTTYETTHGSIIHIELNTDDPDATEAFYEETFGWKFQSVEELPEYTSWQAPSPPNGGLMAPQNGEFTPPSTLFYINVENLAETREAIVEAGGELLGEEMDVPEMGIFALFRDPGGVVEGVWEDQYEGAPPEGGWPKFTDEPELGSVVHFELYTEDPEATQAFHEEVFGWRFETIEDGEYVMAYPPTPPYGGVMEASDEMPAGTVPYILVSSAAETSEEIPDNGGEVLREPFDIKGWGTMAVFEAPGAIVHALWEAAEMESDREEQEVEAAE